MMNQFLLDAAASSEAATSNPVSFFLINLLPIALMIVVFYFLLIRPQKKKEKEVRKMRSDLQVGDEIVTTGGIIGRVVSLRDDTVVIETGTDRSKIRIARWSVQVNNTIHDEA